MATHGWETALGARKTSRRIFAKIRTFATWVSCGTRAEENLHVFDALCARQSTPAPDPAPRRAAPVSPVCATPIKPTQASSIPFRAQSNLPGAQLTVVCPCTACPRPPEPLPSWTGQSSLSQPRPALEDEWAHLGEAPRARNRSLLRRRGQSTVAGVHNPAGVRGPGNPLNHYPIPCAHSLYVIPWSSLCHWIEPDHRDLAGTPAADEDTRLRTGTERFQPSPPASRTSLWPPEPPRANPTPRRTYLAAGKPRHPFLSCGHCLNLGRDRGGEGKKSGGFCEMSVTQMNSSAGV
jgi:hypothetical protein